MGETMNSGSWMELVIKFIGIGVDGRRVLSNNIKIITKKINWVFSCWLGISDEKYIKITNIPPTYNKKIKKANHDVTMKVVYILIKIDKKII